MFFRRHNKKSRKPVPHDQTPETTDAAGDFVPEPEQDLDEVERIRRDIMVARLEEMHLERPRADKGKIELLREQIKDITIAEEDGGSIKTDRTEVQIREITSLQEADKTGRNSTSDGVHHTYQSGEVSEEVPPPDIGIELEISSITVEEQVESDFALFGEVIIQQIVKEDFQRIFTRLQNEQQ